MNKLIYFIVAIMVLAACDRDKLFKAEQYKNVFAFVGDDDNIYECYFDLGNDESVGFAAISVGGSNNITENLTINVVEDKSLVDDYNRTNYDMNVDKYAKTLSDRMYDIESDICTVDAGSVKGIFPIRIRPVGLSPDSTYFIPLKVQSFDNYEVNPDKSYLLFRVRTKNFYATDDGASYTQRGFRKVVGTSSETMIPGVKVLHPLSRNRVRVMAGSEIFEAEKSVINKGAIIIEVGDDNKVKILPYKNIEVTQVDGNEEFPNIFMIEDDGFKTYKTFLLSYKYKYDGVEYEMTEELRMEYNPKEEQ